MRQLSRKPPGHGYEDPEPGQSELTTEPWHPLEPVALVVCEDGRSQYQGPGTADKCSSAFAIARRPRKTAQPLQKFEHAQQLHPRGPAAIEPAAKPGRAGVLKGT